jgi:signal transduction histidine kinase
VTQLASSADMVPELQATIARLREQLARRDSNIEERIAHQGAALDVLKAMSNSPGDPQPVFDLIVQHALHECDGMSCALFEYDGELVHTRAGCGGDAAAISAFQTTFPRPATRDYLVGRAILDRQTIHVRDIESDPGVAPAVRAMGGRTTLSMPLLRDGEAIGAISLNSREAGGFSDSRIALLQTFAEQAVIAISSAKTYRALQERTEALTRRNSEYGERIEQQAAMIEVLEAISISAGDDQPVLALITRRARELCDAETVGVFSFDGTMISIRCTDAIDPKALEPYTRSFPRPPSRDLTIGRAILDRKVVEIDDAGADTSLAAVVHAHGNRSIITLPFLVKDRVAGGMSIAVRKPGGLTDSQKALARILAEQASIAIGAAATVRQLQDRTAALSQSVSELQVLEEVLRAVNSSLELETVLSTIISRAVQLSEADQGTIYEFDEAEQVFVPRSVYGMTADRVEALRDRRIRIGETPLGISAAKRELLHIPDLSQTLDIDGARELVASGMHALLAVPLLRDERVIGGLVVRRSAIGGFEPTTLTLLQTFAGQAVLAIENARLFQEARQARAAAETALADLRRAQDRLVQSEKMASLGQLTAGIAHEIKNPLNFVNNFSDLSRDLLDELNDAVAANQAAEIADLTATLKGNLEKITQHGRRADSIVKNMLLHSRTGPSEHYATDLNVAVEEALNLAYHGARAETPGFNITLERDFDVAAGMVELYPQEFTRVMVNLINNGFYAASKRVGEPGFEPTLRMSTRDRGAEVEVRVRDNGIGIDAAVRDRIFEPFFTTKPAGEGTGLGLSLSYDIIVKQHGGRLIVESEIDAYTEFVIALPRAMAANDGGRP